MNEDMVTVNDDGVNVDTGFGFPQKVSGSRIIRRVSHVLVEREKPNTTVITLDAGKRWCYRCGETRPISYFRSDSARPSGVYPLCRECENELRRKRYADSKGGVVRPYKRRMREGS